MSLPTNEERRKLENLADDMVALARQEINKESKARTSEGEVVRVREYLMGVAWDIKTIARTGTFSEGL